MPTGKIGVYTRFFEYANFRLPLSTFLVDVLRYYHIHISQLSVIAAAKVSHFEILCRVHGCEPTVGLFRCFYVNSKNKGWMSFSRRPGSDTVCYTNPLDSLKGWNDHFFWVDAFAYPASLPWHTSKSVSKDPFPKSTKFNAEHYASLVAYPDPFHKYPEPFLCLVGLSRYYTLDENTYPEFLYENGEGGCFIIMPYLCSAFLSCLLTIYSFCVEMDLLSFIRTADPLKVRISERQRGEDKPKLLDTTVRRVVPLLPVAPDHTEGELEASVDKLFDEGGSGNQMEQGDSVSSGRGIGIQLVSEAAETSVGDVAPLQPRCQRKRKTVIVDYGEPSHPAKKLRKNRGTPGGTFVAGKSMPAIQRLLVGAVQNAEVRGEPIPSLPFMTSYVSATLEREDEDHTDSVAGTNLQTFGPPLRFNNSSDSSHHSGANVAEAEVDYVVRSSSPVITTVTTVTATVDANTTAKEAPTKPSMFGTGSSSVGGTDPTPGGFSDVSGSDFLIGGIRTIVDPC
ncbi:hypothetical protein Tco_0926023 [Tanacetum coccineum]|uniref:Transposase (putative) gypsy type domain-containing protein n=1 Tax=Tanacetum coccineum TaxID=301880 RepID=A0ABQ5DFL6_9ASTR